MTRAFNGGNIVALIGVALLFIPSLFPLGLLLAVLGTGIVVTAGLLIRRMDP